MQRTSSVPSIILRTSNLLQCLMPTAHSLSRLAGRAPPSPPAFKMAPFPPGSTHIFVPLSVTIAENESTSVGVLNIHVKIAEVLFFHRDSSTRFMASVTYYRYIFNKGMLPVVAVTAHQNKKSIPLLSL
jgi:hypothetical protein